MATKDIKVTPTKDVVRTSRAAGTKLKRSIDAVAGRAGRTESGSYRHSTAAQGGSRNATKHVTVPELEVSQELAEAFYTVASRLGEGRTVIVSTAEEELTTTEAAAELGMSRPTLINLLQSGELDYRMVGTHRRIPRSEILRYKGARGRQGTVSAAERRAALRRLSEISEDTGEGY